MRTVNSGITTVSARIAVEKMLGESYRTVKYVADNLDKISTSADEIYRFLRDSGRLYDTVEDGLAATVSGEIFVVLGADGKYALYMNDAGEAVDRKPLSSIVDLASKFAAASDLSADLAQEKAIEASSSASGAASSASTAAAQVPLAVAEATKAQAWAEGTEPGGPGTKSAKGWVEAAPSAIGEVIGDYLGFETFYPTNNRYNPAARRDGYYVVYNTGRILPFPGWACTEYIPVIPGRTYKISWKSGQNRRAGLSFYSAIPSDEAATNPDTYISGITGTVNGVSVIAPQGATRLVVNVQSDAIPEPDELMISEGDILPPYAEWSAPHLVMGEQAGALIVESAEKNLSDNLTADWVNLFEHGDFVGGQPEFRSASPVVDLAQPTLLRRGLARGIQWRAGSDFARYASGGSLLGKWYFAAFVMSSVDGSNFPSEPMAMGYQESAGGTLALPAEAVRYRIQIDNETQMIWETGLIDTDAPNILVGASRTPAVAGTLFASEWTLYLSDSPIDPSQALLQVSLAAKSRVQARRWAQSVSASAADTQARSKLVLTGLNSDAYVESDRSGNLIRTSFSPFRPVDFFNSRKLQLTGNAIGGVEFRSTNDDIAPDHALGTTIDGNHGFNMGTCTATGHGKTEADEGSVWSSGGSEYVLVRVYTADTLYIAARESNAAPVVGTFTHVSGATATADIEVSASTNRQWYPPQNNYNLRIFVDGWEIAETEGEFGYTNNVTIIESCDIMTRQSIIDWWVANGGAGAGFQPDGSPAYRSVIAYRFDQDGQLTVHRDWIVLADDTAISDLMGLQVQRVGAPDTYRIPGAEPFIYDGSTLDYGSGVAANRTLIAAGTPSIYLGATNLQAAGEYGHRVISEWSDKAFAVGLLPVGDAAYDVRRTQVSNRALEIRGSSAKQYFRVLDKGAVTANAGDSFSMVGFRHVLPRVAGKALVCPVRYSDHKAIVYVDWTDFAGLDQVAINCPDLIGRTITVLDSRNATLIGTGLASGNITATVSAEDDHAYLVLEFAA